MAKIILTVRTVNITMDVTTAITKVTSVGSYATIVYYKRKIGMENGDKLVRSKFCAIEHLALQVGLD